MTWRCHNVLELSHSDTEKEEEAVAAYNKEDLLSYFVPPPELPQHHYHIITRPIWDLTEAEINEMDKATHARYYWRYDNWGAPSEICEIEEEYGFDCTALEFSTEGFLPPYKAYRAAVEQHGFELKCYFHQEGMHCGIFIPNEMDLRIYYQKGDVIPDELENRFGIMEQIDLGRFRNPFADDYGGEDPAHRIELSMRDIAPPHEFKDFSKYLTAWLNNEPIGHINADGYRVINIEGRDYYMHDLVYAYMKGRWPNGEVEHINGKKDDNRWANLKLKDAPIPGGLRSAAPPGLLGS